MTTRSGIGLASVLLLVMKSSEDVLAVTVCNY